ncbi:MAG TPA: YqhA family protein [Longimicrobium sp.]|jgi:uncharacterized membrane protein YqhA
MLERGFERLLWGSRLIVLLAVVASLVVAVGMFFVATVDVIGLLEHVAHYAAAAVDERPELRSTIVAHVVEVVDGYLLASIMLIFSLGLYELFISRIEAAEGSEFAERLLLIRSLDDLKDRLAKVVLLILVVKFFEYALQLSFQTPLDLLYLAIGVLLVSAALYLSHGRPGKDAH